MTAALPKGINCPCGHFDKYPSYIYAHTRDVIDFTCPKCGRKYTIVNLCATPVDPARPKRARAHEYNPPDYPKDGLCRTCNKRREDLVHG